MNKAFDWLSKLSQVLVAASLIALVTHAITSYGKNIEQDVKLSEHSQALKEQRTINEQLIELSKIVAVLQDRQER